MCCRSHAAPLCVPPTYVTLDLHHFSTQTEMAMRLGRFVTIDNLSSNRSTNRRPSVNDDTMEAGNAEAIAVLLSKNVLHEPLALIELYQAPPLIFARYSLLTACYCTHYSHLARAHMCMCMCMCMLHVHVLLTYRQRERRK